MVELEWRDTMAPPQPHNLTLSVVVGVLALGLREQVALMEVREVLEVRMVEVVEVAERVDTQPRLGLVVLEELVEEVQLKFFFIGKQAQTNH
jgi:hypothetical protein